MAPIVRRLATAEGVDARVCVTAQHRTMLDDALQIFGITPDYDLDVMRPGQTLSGISSAVLSSIDPVLAEFAPDWVIVQGDTTTTMAAALAAFHRRIKVGHVEAGLRTGDLENPWPEEANRRIASIVTTRHYCPTDLSRRNLLREGVDPGAILVTGNTVIDALHLTAEKMASDRGLQEAMERRFDWLDPNKRLILVTGHRRESFGSGFQQICEALAHLGRRGDVQIVYPVHLNPNVRGPVFEILSESPAIKLIEPLDYVSFLWLMQRSHFILTDSGGVQEEGPSLGKPVLVMRETTERPEGVDAGTARLVGTKAKQIVAECAALIEDEARYRVMSTTRNPYGDGTAAAQIVADLLRHREP